MRSYCIPHAYLPEENVLYRNEGKGRFTDVSKAAGIARPAGKSLGVAVADYDRDGWPDIFVANDTTPTQPYHNTGNGTFSEQAAPLAIAYDLSGRAKAGMGIDIADDCNEGLPSVAIGNFSGERVGYYQYRDGFFEERSVAAGLGGPSRQFLTFGTLFLDVDNDGWKDLFLANGHVQDNVARFHSDLTYAQRPLLFQNRGRAIYREVGPQAGGPLALPIRGPRGRAGGLRRRRSRRPGGRSEQRSGRPLAQRNHLRRALAPDPPAWGSFQPERVRRSGHGDGGRAATGLQHAERRQQP